MLEKPHCPELNTATSGQYEEGIRQKPAEDCLLRLLEESNEDDWLEIILYFKKNIFPLVKDISGGQFENAAWRLRKMTLQKQSILGVARIFSKLGPRGKEAAESLNLLAQSHTFGVVVHIHGYLDICAQIMLDLENGDIFEATLHAATHTALTWFGLGKLYPNFNAIYGAYAKGNYWEVAVRTVALGIPMMKHELGLSNVPILSQLIDVSHDVVVHVATKAPSIAWDVVYPLVVNDATMRLIYKPMWKLIKFGGGIALDAFIALLNEVQPYLLN